MPVGYRSFGDIWCPGCALKREFVTFDMDIEDVDYAECAVCGYVHGKRIDDTAQRDKGQSDVMRAIPKHIAQRAKDGQKSVVQEAVRARGLTRMPSSAAFEELRRREETF